MANDRLVRRRSLRDLFDDTAHMIKTDLLGVVILTVSYYVVLLIMLFALFGASVYVAASVHKRGPWLGESSSVGNRVVRGASRNRGRRLYVGDDGVFGWANMACRQSF